jgi:hypothetical protein
MPGRKEMYTNPKDTSIIMKKRTSPHQGFHYAFATWYYYEAVVVRVRVLLFVTDLGQELPHAMNKAPGEQGLQTVLVVMPLDDCSGSVRLLHSNSAPWAIQKELESNQELLSIEAHL